MFGKIILLYTVAYVNCQFYPAPCFQNPQSILAPVPNLPMYANPCPCGLPGPIMANLPYEVPVQTLAPIPSIPVPVRPTLPAPALVPSMPYPELAMPACVSKFLLPEVAIPNPVGCFESAVTPYGTLTELPNVGNPFLPIASPVSAMAPFSPLLPPASPCGCRCQYLKKIPIPPPCI